MGVHRLKTVMPRRSFNGSLRDSIDLRFDTRSNLDLLYPRTNAGFPAPSKISAADRDAVIPMLAESGRHREAFVREQAGDVAQRYLDERNKFADKTPENIWGNARMTSKEIMVAPSLLPDPRSVSRVPRHVKASFDAFDANHSGYLDYRELRNALAYLGIDVGSDRAAAQVLGWRNGVAGRLTGRGQHRSGNTRKHENGYIRTTRTDKEEIIGC